MWRSLVAYLHGVQVVAGSNPVIPTKKIQRESVGFFVCGKRKLVCKLGANKKDSTAARLCWICLSTVPPLWITPQA